MNPGASPDEQRSSGPRRIAVRLAVAVAVLAWVRGAVFGCGLHDAHARTDSDDNT
jgi:hypothetical protein